MTQMIALEAELRNNAGTSASRTLRGSGKIPAIIYGGGAKETKISLSSKEVTQEYLKSGFISKLVSIKIGNDTVLALPREIQRHPVTDKISHADFQRINKGEKVKVFVKVDFQNADKSPGLKRGGVLNMVRREIEFICLPEAIPDSVVVDLTGLAIGHSVHIKDIKLPEGVVPAISDRNFTVATIAGAAAKEEDAVAAAPGAQPVEVPATAQKAVQAPGAQPAATTPAKEAKGKDSK